MTSKPKDKNYTDKKDESKKADIKSPITSYASKSEHGLTESQIHSVTLFR